MLPRESDSKECSASLLSIISYPAFAVEDTTIIDATKSEILGKLEGSYGCKRFLRDGHHCMNEDRHRLHYELHELSKFEKIECEWPLFFCYLLLDGIYNKNEAQVEKYSRLLERLLIQTEDGVYLLPELFYVPLEKLDAEREEPRSQQRLCGDHVPHLWTQSLFILGLLLKDGFVAAGELDPLNRRYVTAPKPELVVQVALIAEDEEIKDLLAEKGIESQTVEEVSPIRILPAKCLVRLYNNLGQNAKLGLSGRPNSSLGIFGIGSLYRSDGHLLAFTPQFLDYRQFYLCLDNELVIDSFKTEIEYLRSNWKQLGRPTLTLPITHALLEGSLDSTAGKFLLQVNSGYLYSVRIRVGKLSEMQTRSSIKNIDFVDSEILEDLISFAPDPTKSTRPGDLPHSQSKRGRCNSHDRRLSVHGSVIRSRSISRAASWGASSSDEENSVADLVRGFVLDGMRSRDQEVCDGEMEQEEEVDIEVVREQLENSTDINEQADILQFLYKTRGYHFDVALNGNPGCTVEKLLRELYEKACHLKSWGLIRHISGMLRKQVEYLGPNCTELLVHQKQIGVGLPHLQREEIIDQPLPPRALKKLIYSSCGCDSSSAVLTQEILTYLAMFVKTHPALFDGMLQIRIGLIMEVMAAEYARTTGLTGEEAADQLMSLTPFQMKSLLYYILTGKEFGVKMDLNKSVVIDTGESSHSGLAMFRTAVKRISQILRMKKKEVGGGDNENMHPRKIGQWLRRRCLDGALNRVPSNFYVKIWHVLTRCHGLSVDGNFFLEHRLTQENTSGEMKFALRVENELNKIVYPEYRQLVVEVLMVLYVFMERDIHLNVDKMIPLDTFVSKANKLFLNEQREGFGDATLCCASREETNMTRPCNASNNICRYFYDSAPSGTYGTMTYFTKVVLQYLYKDREHSNDIFI
ncbi:phosphorylase b kinase regulatory subunit alpha, liver isoform-like [Clytia hemisphaerica]